MELGNVHQQVNTDLASPKRKAIPESKSVLKRFPNSKRNKSQITSQATSQATSQFSQA